MKYLPIQINGEWCLRQENQYTFIPVPMFSGETREENYQWGNFEQQALATTKPIINHDGREGYDSSELTPLYQMQDTETGIWGAVRYINELVDDQDSPILEAWKYIGEKFCNKCDYPLGSAEHIQICLGKNIQKVHAISIKSVQFQNGEQAERIRIIDIIKSEIQRLREYKSNRGRMLALENVLTKINDL